MARASKLFSDEDKQNIAEAVAEAEKTTSGEIVPVVTTMSGRYDRAEDIFGVLLALIVVAVLGFTFRLPTLPGDWGQPVAVSLWRVLALFLITFIVGAALATYIPLLARPFIGRRELEQEVLRSAQLAFSEFRVRGTEGGTGILIYVSLFERRVAVIGDEPISEKLDQEQWDEVKDLVIAGLKKGKPTEGICNAIKRCGELLSEHFPIAPDDVNELSNELHIID
ncbi:MAG: hypothetical protein GXP25_22670 [Planctomycetes bacterium]|nr:hypothetical protein [Planctomycetota bacterium]